MPAIEFTPEQRRAIETVDRSVLVSAAAGSGKTAVLAARCGHLICDAPPPYRCGVDELLVVTFTEAAAAEMKQRINRALRERAESGDERLRTQLALIDTVQISTLHAFCLWMVRRWFHRVGVDAHAQLLDEDEARLLKHEALSELLNEHYAGDGPDAEAFRRLVEDYGLGYDGVIAQFVLQLANFLVSLPEPQAWVQLACGDSAERRAMLLADWESALRVELRRQAEHCTAAARVIDREWPTGAFYAGLLRDYQAQLDDWAQRIEHGRDFERVRQDILAYELSSRGSPRLGKSATPEEITERDRARDVFADVQKTLLKTRLQKRLARFSAEELSAGFDRVMPYAQTLVLLADAFVQRFDAVKRALGVMDFADLERLAYRLLTERLPDEEQNPVTAELRGRFAHVLVDEYQDINPLQATLLALVSREASSAQAGNLFTVGDVKQSIYRFRLAEPVMFLRRAAAFRRGEGGACIDLQRNYRSFRNVLECVNALFRQLMQDEVGGIAYDEHAELKAPEQPLPPVGEPVELHVLARKLETDDDQVAAAEDDDVPRYVDVNDPAQWGAVEREAFRIGTRIDELFRSGMQVGPPDDRRPLAYRDICILLRSTRHSAAAIAGVLTQMGIPTWTDAGHALFEAQEVRDVLALLAVLDNIQQDIPLTAVLRSGMLGERCTEDDLLAIRRLDKRVDFHEAVRAYARRGPDVALREKLNGLLRRLEHYRRDLRDQPLADVLWRIYRDTGYFAYVGGLRGGEQRRANLVALHERARQFGGFRRQGLRRFLRFIESLQAVDQDLGAPSAVGEAENVVRIMSIHKSKGLEFPVVIAAEMGRAFNRTDATGRFLFDRTTGVGLKAVDRDRLIEYPTVLHRACARSADEASQAEELRVWYVALTRAREKLILVGTEDLEKLERMRAMARANAGQVGPLQVLSAQTPLHWVVAAHGAIPPARVTWDEATGPDAGVLLEVTTYAPDEILDWRLPAAASADDAGLRKAVAALAPLPPAEPLSRELEWAVDFIDRLDYAYPHLETSSVQAARAASGVKRPHDWPDEESAPVVADARAPAHHTAASADARQEGIRRGRVVHSALELLRLDQAADAAQIAQQMDRLAADGLLDAADVPLIDVDALAWFFNTPLGRRIRAAGDDGYRREWMFLASEPADRFDRLVTGDADDRVLVRGVVDGILTDQAGLAIVDYKTDRVDAGDVDARAADYALQLQLYAAAVSAVFGRPVTARYLVFLHGRRIVEVEDASS